MNNGVHAGPQLSAETMGNSVPREGVSISLNDTPASGISGPMEISGVAGPTVGSTRRTSRVWRYFGMVDNCHYICRLCYFVGAYTNTTNMRKHIQHHHPERFQDILDHTRPTTRPFYSNTLIGMRPHLQQFPPQAHQQPQPQQQHPTFPTAANAMVYPHSIIAGKRAVPQPYSSSEQRQHPVVTTHQHSPLRIHHAPATTSSLQSCLIPHHTSSVSIPSSISFETASSYSCSVAQSVITTARASTPRPNIPSVAAYELNQDESEIVTQILPPLATAAESSNDSEGCVKGLAGGDERGSSEYSQNDEETPAVASPEQFMAEGSEREPTPTPVASSPPKPESYQLRHNNHLTIVLEALARDEAFMDVTLTAQGRSLKAHKSVLSAVSPYFRSVLRENPCQHPIIIMPRDVRFEELFSIVNYIYKGEMTVAAEDLTSLLKTAEILQVSGLAPSDSTAIVNPHMDITTSGNLRSSSASSTSSSNIPSAVKTVKKARATNQEISHPHSRPKSPDGMINPSDFMDMDMTYVKEEVQSGGEDDEEEGEEESGGSEVTKTTSPKRFETQPQDTAPYPTISTSSQEDPASTPNGSSQDFGGSYVKMETESNSMSSLDSSKLQFETPQPFICPFCQENHRSIENIATHLRLNHPSKPNFVCRCGRVFTRNTYYQAHVKVCPSSSS